MQVTPIIFNNISNVQPTCLKSRESNQEQLKQAVVTNPIVQNKVMPSADLLKSYVGIKEPKAEQKQELSAYDYLLTLPNVKQTFKTELAVVAKVMEKMDVESSNTEMMVNLVAEGKLWRGVLRYFCENGKMSKNMESDVDLIYNAYADGKKPIDAYVPTVQDKQAGIKSVKVGDTFEVDGEKNIYFKDSDDNARQLKVSKETFAELFPPAERFAGVQGAAGDCYLLATLNTMIENPQKRGVLYDMFEETDNSVNVTIPTGETVYSAPKNDLRQGIDKWQHMQGATGMILAEHAYGVELQHRLENEFHTFMNSEIARMEKVIKETDSKVKNLKTVPPSTTADAGKVLTVNEDGSVSWQQKGEGGGMKAYFDAGGKCANSTATSFDGSIPFTATSDVTDMHSMFSSCSSLTSAPLLDTSNVTDMSNMFSYCSSLTSAPLLDTSKVTEMSNMF